MVRADGTIEVSEEVLLDAKRHNLKSDHFCGG
jgi:hypothetical protein